MREASDLRAQLTRVLLADPPAGSFLGGASRGSEGALALRASAKRELEAARGATTRAKKKDAPSDPAALALTGEGPGDVALRRALLVGWADRVARRVRASDAAIPGDDADASSRSSGSKATRYLPALLDRSVYLHPSSALGKAAPEYVLYADLIQTEKRPYVAGATAIDAAWLATDAKALVSLSAPLDDPPPRYAPARGAVIAFRAATFGRHRWRLPLVASVAGADTPGSCEAFAVALLDGRVSRAMATLAGRLAAKPATCAKPEGKAQRRVADLTHALRKRRVADGAALGDAWRRDPAWLMAEVRAWMKRGHEHALERIWPNVVAGVAGGGSAAGETQTETEAPAETATMGRRARRRTRRRRKRRATRNGRRATGRRREERRKRPRGASRGTPRRSTRG
jgi:ATP-dependent RNA helicase DHX37/DHR1